MKNPFDIFRPNPHYVFGLRRKKFYDIKKERGEIFTLNGKKYICDGFLPQNNPLGDGIYATEIS